MPRIKVRRVDGLENRNMVEIRTAHGHLYAAMHINALHEGGGWEEESGGEVFRRIYAGEELTLELTIVETPEQGD